MASASSSPLALALHGGSGTLSKSLEGKSTGPFREALAEALEEGWQRLSAGASALDVVEAVAAWLEDCPLFNAGRGSVFTHQGGHEMDAAVMEGGERRAGAVAGVRMVRHPVSLARAVLEDGRFVLLAGEGAEAFAATTGLECMPAEWFGTPERRAQLEQARRASRMTMDHDRAAPADDKFGTIGAVACDARGNLAAATSTGGLTNKRFGRVGDSPLIGAGTYADNRTCAVSCTGYGEEFIRGVAAHEVAARIRYAGERLDRAASAVVHENLPLLGGRGGLIAVDTSGNVALPFNTEGMYRAWRNSLGDDGVAVFAGPGEA